MQVAMTMRLLMREQQLAGSEVGEEAAAVAVGLRHRAAARLRSRLAKCGGGQELVGWLQHGA
jgi:hypothetical protein